MTSARNQEHTPLTSEGLKMTAEAIRTAASSNGAVSANGNGASHTNGHSNGHTATNGNGHSNGHAHRPRVLFLSYRFPYPLIGGDRIKSYHLVRHLSSVADVDLMARRYRAVLHHLAC